MIRADSEGIPRRIAPFRRQWMKSAAASSLAGFVLAAGLAAGANAASLDARYDVSLLGITLGTASLSGGIDNSSYKLDMTAKLTGIAGGVTGGRGSGAATGVLVGGRLAPKTFAVSSANSSESRTVRMALAEGAVAGIDIEPPIDEKPDRVPLNESHKRNIVDPLSAFLMPVNGKGKDAACNRTLPIFDGESRMDFQLTSKGTKPYSTKGFKGEAVVCGIRFIPKSGYKKGRDDVEYLRRLKTMEIWFAKAEEANVYAPVYVRIPTKLGPVTVSATRFGG